MGSALTFLDPGVQEVYNRVKGTKQSLQFHCEIYLTPSLESVLRFNQCKAYGNVTQYNEISP